MLSFHIISTFEDGEQDIFEFELKKLENIDEKSLLKIIFKSLENLEKLEKLSICQLNSTKENCLEWLLKTNGKYYFNINVNDDEETLHWNNFRNEYINYKEKTSNIYDC
jgi:hypothetical protein